MSDRLDPALTTRADFERDYAEVSAEMSRQGVSGLDVTPFLLGALARKTGARGLRSILEGILLGTMYELPSLEGVSKVVVDEKVVLGESEPLLVYDNPETARAMPE